MKKLKAFTLMELLIGMIISSMVIASGYYAYSIIFDRFEKYRDVKKKLVTGEQLNSILNNDAFTADLISFRDDELVLTKGPEKSIRYHFYDERIIRTEQEVSDTFAIAAVDIQPQFLFPENNSFVQQFSFKATLLDEKAFFCFTKSYPAELLMQHKLTNEDQH
jgi:prepilin-type N-terminal cleavage/methylation domain-containing protein